jgi:hypothetical protein
MKALALPAGLLLLLPAAVGAAPWSRLILGDHKILLCSFEFVPAPVQGRPIAPGKLRLTLEADSPWIHSLQRTLRGRGEHSVRLERLDGPALLEAYSVSIRGPMRLVAGRAGYERDQYEVAQHAARRLP